jgi:hypothetical protein
MSVILHLQIHFIFGLFFSTHIIANSMGRVLVSRTVDCGLETRSSHTKDYKIGS